jgi:hypothetical protein
MGELAQLMPAVRTLADAAATFETLLDRLVELEPAVADHLALRRHLVADYAGYLKAAVTEASGGRQQVFLQCFPPPWNTLSGFDIARLGRVADLVGVKFYTMHWPMMLRSYVEAVAAASGLGRDLLARTLQRLFLSGGTLSSGFDGLVYPEPDVAHNVGRDVIAAKFEAAGGADSGLIAIAHGYGPTDDVRERFAAAWQVSGGRVELNRYGYLSDEKLEAIRSVVAGRSA